MHRRMELIATETGFKFVMASSARTWENGEEMHSNGISMLDFLQKAGKFNLEGLSRADKKYRSIKRPSV